MENKHDCYIVTSDGILISDNLKITNTFAGLEYSVYQSGKFQATELQWLKKRGSTYLRWTIIQAACLVAISHTSKKLLRVIFHLLKNNINSVPQI